MISKSKDYWKGSAADDINEYLRLYSKSKDIEIKNVVCESCGGTDFVVDCDSDECAIRVKCARCGRMKFIADSEEYWEDADPETVICPICGCNIYNVKAGFVRDEERIKWIYIGIRCIRCGALGSPLDWSIDYEPDEELDRGL